MAQSLARVLTHLIFSTKHRVALLTPALQAELHPYLAGVLNEMDCPALQVGGTEDHVHLFFGLSRTRTLAAVVETLKTSSSKWIKRKGPELYSFHWQAGYACFSVSQSRSDEVCAYIRNQAGAIRK
jgi:REP element-mobilizing transposase RayT